MSLLTRRKRDYMRVLCIGDVVGSVGCDFLRKTLPKFKKINAVDFVICNGENSADGNGIIPASAQHLFTSSVDVLTLGNHSFQRREIYNFLDSEQCIIRPANFPSPSTPGRGYCTVDLGRTSVTVINLMGQEYMDAKVDNPFYCIDEILKNIDSKIIIVDIHAETTSEKKAMGFYLDSKVSAVFGTHTHVQTADECVLSGGTGYITDVGMTGPVDSVIGVRKEIIINRFRTKLPERFDYADGECMLNAVLFDIDDKTGRCKSVERFDIR